MEQLRSGSHPAIAGSFINRPRKNYVAGSFSRLRLTRKGAPTGRTHPQAVTAEVVEREEPILDHYSMLLDYDAAGNLQSTSYCRKGKQITIFADGTLTEAPPQIRGDGRLDIILRGYGYFAHGEALPIPDKALTTNELGTLAKLHNCIQQASRCAYPGGRPISLYDANELLAFEDQGRLSRCDAILPKDLLPDAMLEYLLANYGALAGTTLLSIRKGSLLLAVLPAFNEPPSFNLLMKEYGTLLPGFLEVAASKLPAQKSLCLPEQPLMLASRSRQNEQPKRQHCAEQKPEGATPVFNQWNALLADGKRYGLSEAVIREATNERGFWWCRVPLPELERISRAGYPVKFAAAFELGHLLDDASLQPGWHLSPDLIYPDYLPSTRLETALDDWRAGRKFVRRHEELDEQSGKTAIIKKRNERMMWDALEAVESGEETNLFYALFAHQIETEAAVYWPGDYTNWFYHCRETKQFVEDVAKLTQEKTGTIKLTKEDCKQLTQKMEQAKERVRQQGRLRELTRAVERAEKIILTQAALGVAVNQESTKLIKKADSKPDEAALMGDMKTPAATTPAEPEKGTAASPLLTVPIDRLKKGERVLLALLDGPKCAPEIDEWLKRQHSEQVKDVPRQLRLLALSGDIEATGDLRGQNKTAKVYRAVKKA